MKLMLLLSVAHSALTGAVYPPPVTAGDQLSPAAISQSVTEWSADAALARDLEQGAAGNCYSLPDLSLIGSDDGVITQTLLPADGARVQVIVAADCDAGDGFGSFASTGGVMPDQPLPQHLPLPTGYREGSVLAMRSRDPVFEGDVADNFDKVPGELQTRRADDQGSVIPETEVSWSGGNAFDLSATFEIERTGIETGSETVQLQELIAVPGLDRTIFGTAMPFTADQDGSHPYVATVSPLGETPSAQETTSAAPPEEAEERTVTLNLPLVVNDRPFLPITATITTQRVVAVNATDIVRSLSEVVDDATLDRLVSLGDRSVGVDELAELGITVTLNTATLALELRVDENLLRGSTIRASQELSFSGVERVQPSNFSFGLTAAAIASSPLDNEFDPRSAIGFAGFLNVGGIEGLNVDYGGDISISNGGERSIFQRDRITAFKDWPDRALRISGGDLVPTQARLAGAFDILGVSIERNYEALQPIRNIRPTASRSLRLDRQSVVEVYVNEVLVERFFADPGPIDITDIPMAAFSNNVTIVVEDSLGRREVDSFVFGSDITLLAEGIDQFDLSIGVLRNLNSSGFSYSGTPVASAFYERGLTPNLTLAGHAVVTDRQQNIGAAAAFGIPVGTITADFAFSHDDNVGTGLAVGATFRGSPFVGVDQGEFATLTFDYRTRDFSTVSQFGVIEDIKFDLGADYQVNLSQPTAIFASANYVERYSVDGGDSFYSAGVRQNFGLLFVTLAARYADRATTGGEFGVLATVTIPMGRRNSVTATYDTASNRGRAEFRRQRGLQLPEIDYRVGISTDTNGETLFGGFGYANSRFDADADIATRFGSGDAANETIASARFQTGIGFADGKFAIGRDAARGFTIISRHPSIKDATLTARTSAAGRELGIANEFGPGLFAINSPFRPQQIAVDATGVPVGYDLGAGTYLLEIGARSGLVIEVGDDAFRTVVTTIVFESEPVALEYGQYRKIGDESGPAGTFFTNRAGRAAFSDLAPGEYLVEFPDRRIAGRFTVSEDSDALIRIDALEMERQ